MIAEILKTRGKALTVTNRDFKLPEDGYIQIVSIEEAPIGLEVTEHLTGQREQPAIQVLDREAIKSMAATFKGEVLVDYEHFSHDGDKETKAAGWIQNVQAREDGLYAQIRWSQSGKAALEGGDYRFISPEFPVEHLEHLGGNRYRATVMNGAGLTNRPGLKKIKPLSNRGGMSSTSSHAQQQQTEKTDMDLKTILCSLLAIAPTATDEQIRNRLTAFQDEQRAKDDQLKELETIKNREKGYLEQLADRDLEKYSGVIKNRDKVREQLITNRDATLELLENLELGDSDTTTAQTQAANNPPAKTVFNRNTAKGPENVINKANDAADKEAAFVANRASELIKATPNMSLSDAYRRAQNEYNAKN